MSFGKASASDAVDDLSGPNLVCGGTRRRFRVGGGVMLADSDALVDGCQLLALSLWLIFGSWSNRGARRFVWFCVCNVTEERGKGGRAAAH